ncbi:MAG: helix-turn-helix transcriptional regulator [Candidatus Competibacter sp.]|nr:helix-turn-helix transcriptional regulator [Candidatus Competibacter sp.]MDG4606235.1 helix-turn-helix transcriptional regulator [Candidatus Contendobacter sp.]HRD50409.1 helix-turn-helix transcriptional regulator [Candidatus Contendobacter sp.]
MKKAIGQWVGHQIKVRRVDLEMNQGNLAERLGVSQAYLSYLEKGQRQITLELLERIASALQCRMADLLPPDDNRREAA